jgi:ACS family glucarate transporter-like MFS transporter
MAVILYLHRFALTPITSSVLAELKLDEEQFGRAVGAFFFVYALCQVPAGLLSDRFGARWTLAAYVVAWSLATIGLGLAAGLVTITAMRMLLGAAQAGAYPAAASLLKRWVPAAGRARANTIVSMGGRAGNLLAQFLTPILTVAALSLFGWQTGGWRVVLAAYGSLGLVWAALFVWLYRDQPSTHPWCNPAERDLIGHTPPSAKQATSPLALVLGVLLSPDVWLISIMGISVNIGWVFLVTWLPRYLITRHGSELAQYVSSPEVFAGTLTAVAGLGAMLGGLSGGAAADRFVANYGLKWGRRLPGLTAGLVAAVLYLVAMQMTSVWPLVALMIAISFTIDFGLGAVWASYQDIGGRHVATVLGIGNMCGNFGAAFFSYYIGVLAKADRWNTVFFIASLAMAVYAGGWLLFDARRPVVREAE